MNKKVLMMMLALLFGWNCAMQAQEEVDDDEFEDED